MTTLNSHSTRTPLADVATTRAVEIVINRDSGGGAKARKLSGAIMAAFKERAWEPRLSIARGPRIAAEIDRAASTNPAILVVAGGDGTIRTAAARVLEHDIPLGIIPLGTMNFLAKDLAIPLHPVSAAYALADGSVIKVDVAEVNSEIFLHSSLIGIFPRIGVEREHARGMRRLVSGWWMSRAIVRSVLYAPNTALLVTSEAASHPIRTFGVAVSNNPLSAGLTKPFTRASLDTGKLAAYVCRHKTRLGLVRLLFSVGSGLWTIDPLIEVDEAYSISVRSMRGTLRISNDGEIHRVNTPLIYKVRPRALAVVVPAKSDKNHQP